MVKNEFLRMQVLIDNHRMEKLKSAHVAIFGIGGVGGYAAESIARCGVQKITLVDEDVVDITNINRQIIAMHSTIGRPKVEVMKERILDINPKAEVNIKKIFYGENNIDQFDFSNYSYVIDAIDTLSSKISLIEQSNIFGTKIISSMGTANKINPTMFEVSDIYSTSGCPLARVLRRELRKKNINSLKVVYSKEKTMSSINLNSDQVKPVLGSFAFVPSVAGLILSSEVVKDILSET